MSEETMRPHYGYYALQWMSGTVVCLFILGIVLSFFVWLWLGAFFIVFALYLAVSYAYSMHARDQSRPFQPPDILDLRGDERVLDVGCGLGKMTIGVAKQLTTGSVVGYDLWVSAEIPGNSPERAMENARLEGVAETVIYESGDLRSMPFDDASFDVVTALNVINNIGGDTEKLKALKEIFRVLKPGGKFLLIETARNLWGFLTVTPLVYWAMQKEDKWLQLLRDTDFIDAQSLDYQRLTTILVKKPLE